MTKRGLAWMLGVAVGALAAPAYADSSDGCSRDSPPSDSPPRALFGSGSGYTAGVVAADIGAMVTSAILFSVSYAINNDNVSLATIGVATVPLVLAGPLVHFIDGRPIFGVISMIGWASLEATAIGLGVGLGESSSAPSCWGCGPGQDNRLRGGVVGVSIAVGGGALMTLLDGWMARSVHAPAGKAKATITPSVWTTAGGGGASVVGTF